MHQARLRQYAAIKKEHFYDVDAMSAARQFQYLTLQRGIIFEHAWLTWCEETEKFLRDQGSKRDIEKKR